MKTIDNRQSTDFATDGTANQPVSTKMSRQCSHELKPPCLVVSPSPIFFETQPTYLALVSSCCRSESISAARCVFNALRCMHAASTALRGMHVCMVPLDSRTHRRTLWIACSLRPRRDRQSLFFFWATPLEVGVDSFHVDCWLLLIDGYLLNADYC